MGCGCSKGTKVASSNNFTSKSNSIKILGTNKEVKDIKTARRILKRRAR